MYSSSVMLVVLRRSSIKGVVRGPSSKSVAQRLILASLLCSQGRCVLDKVMMSDDVDASLRFVRAFGVQAEQIGDRVVLEVPEEVNPRTSVVDLGDSGTTYRIALGLAATFDREIVLECGKTMRNRPVEDLVAALKRLGAKVRYLERNGYPPVAVKGPIRGGKVEIPGKISSQFISALVYAGARSIDGIEIHVKPPVVSKAYIGLTVNVLRLLGADVELEDLEDEGLIIYSYPRELKSFEIEIPADYALSAYLFAIAGLAGEEIAIYGFNPAMNPVDREIIRLLREMNLRVKDLGESVYVSESDRPEPVEVSLRDNPDLVMPLVAVAVYARGVTVIKDVWHLAYKESNRLRQISECVSKFGGSIEVRSDRDIIVHGVERTVPAEVELPDDHRIAMMCSVLGLNTEGETRLRNAECVKKSWPTYWDDLKRLGAEVKVVK